MSVEQIKKNCKRWGDKFPKPNKRVESRHPNHKGICKAGSMALSCRYCLGIWDYPEENEDDVS